MRSQTILLLTLFFILEACSESPDFKQNSSDKIASDSSTHTSPIEEKDTISTLNSNPDNIDIHVFQKGETLWELSKKYYGNRHYSSILSIYNEIQDVNRIEPGAEIKIPSLNKILIDKTFGLVPPLKKEVYKILAARQMYVEVEQILWDLRQATGWKGEQNLPEGIKINLERAADLIDLTIIQLSQPKESPSSIPDKMITNLKSVSRNLKKLASGANDGYGYDLDMIHQDLIRAILNGRVWVKKNYSEE